MFFKDEFAFMSNFYLVDVEMYGLIYPSVEHAYQAAKFKDKNLRKQIRQCRSPQEAKYLGRSFKLRDDWESIKVNVMKILVSRKYQHKYLFDFLQNTGNIPLEEGNFWHDNFWGNCYCTKCKSIVGLNHLGIITMEIRQYGTDYYQTVAVG